MENDNNFEDNKDPKEIFDDLLEESIEQGHKFVETGQDLTEAGQYIVDLSSGLRDVLSTEEHDIDVEPLIDDWKMSNEHIKFTLSHIEKVDIPAVYSTTGTMTVSSGSVIDPRKFEGNIFIPESEDVEGPFVNLSNVISRFSNEEEVISLLTELGFDQKIGDRESPLDRFIFAHEAYKKPVSPDNPAVTSLIPIREAIGGVISELLKRRPNQERARNWHDKIISIGRQLKRESLSMDLVESWAQKWEVILNDLSEAKEKELTRAEWLHLLRQATIFLKNLLNGLDPGKFRK